MKSKIMPQCGFDSTPADMLSWVLVNYIRKALAVPTREVIFSAEEVKYGSESFTKSSLEYLHSPEWLLAVVPWPRQ